MGRLKGAARAAAADADADDAAPTTPRYTLASRKLTVCRTVFVCLAVTRHLW